MSEDGASTRLLTAAAADAVTESSPVQTGDHSAAERETTPTVMAALGQNAACQDHDEGLPVMQDQQEPMSLPVMTGDVQEKRGILAKLRRKSSSAASHQGRMQRSRGEDAESGDAIVDPEISQDVDRSARRLSSLVHGVQNLKRRLAARQMVQGTAAERRHHRASLDSGSSDGSELSSSGSDGSSVAVGAGSNRSSLLSNTSTSSEDSTTSTETSTSARALHSLPGYGGPFVGRARARCDYVPSPYDREALRFSRGDVIDVISMNPSGLWRGALYGRVGTFKFISVEVLRDERARRQAAGRSLPAPLLSARPRSVPHLLQLLRLPPEYAGVFSLHGFDRLEDFHGLEEDQLSDLGIVQPQHRACLLAAAQLLAENAEAESAASEPLCDFTQPLLSELIRDSGCYDVWRISDHSDHSRPHSDHGAPLSDDNAHSDPTSDRVSENAAAQTCAVSVISTESESRQSNPVASDAVNSADLTAPAQRLPVTPVSEEVAERLQLSSGSEKAAAGADTLNADGWVHARPVSITTAELTEARPRGLSSPTPCRRRSPSKSPRPSSSPPRVNTHTRQRDSASQPRAAVDFEKKFLSARSVFESESPVRRQIPVGVRPRLGAAGAPAADLAVADEVSV